MTSNQLPEQAKILSPLLSSKFGDIYSLPNSQQGQVCAFFEAQFYRCMEAFGSKLGRKYCDLEHRDYHECVTKEKQETMIPADRLGKIYSKEWCRRHRKRPLHILNILKNRELGTAKPGTFFLNGSREFYQCMKMEKTCSVPFTNFTPMRFTPDGQQLVYFNTATQEVKVSWYNGVTAIRQPENDNAEPLFSNHFTIQIDRYDRTATLCKELCLITADSKHMVIAYVVSVGDGAALLHQMMSTNESVSPSGGIEHTVFLSVDLKKGMVSDILRMDYDSVRIPAAVYLVDRTFGVLSVQHQIIYIFKLDSVTGVFGKIREIGRKLYADDEELFLRFDQHQYSGMTERVYTDILLIRLGIGASPEQCARKEDDKSPAMFVIFDWREAEILAIFNRSSELLFKLFVNFSETFRNGSIVQNHFPTTMEHCQLLREHHDSTPDSALEVRNRVLNVLPCLGTGTPMFTPFLDAHYFSFEERILPYIENTRFSSNQEVKIFCRKTCAPVLYINLQKHVTTETSFMRLLFHPHDPLVLLSDRFCTDSRITIFSLPLVKDDARDP
ncbi:DET1-like protein [Aphelenchoides besseyi]|nr:DET1-like protein [Aphelenchoides besseyi]